MAMPVVSRPMAVHTDRRHPILTKTACGPLFPMTYLFLPSGCLGCCAFLVDGAHACNDLPVDVTSAPSLHTFRKRLKLHLFRLSYPSLVTLLDALRHVNPSSEWRLSCISCFKLWSNFLVLVTMRIAAFITRCSLLVTTFGAPARTTLQ